MVACEIFPSVDVLAVNTDASIADYCHRVESTVAWLPIFIRAAFVDQAILVGFLSKLNGITLLDSSANLVTWDLNSKGFSLSNLII